mmetsp:Transcript_103994/g.179713  ORF Transcript_103994/g.179713 Transcript_103994/m.179713 type:complete len:102 (-) Transcript_103994:41-346(-)
MLGQTFIRALLRSENCACHHAHDPNLPGLKNIMAPIAKELRVAGALLRPRLTTEAVAGNLEMFGKEALPTPLMKAPFEEALSNSSCLKVFLRSSFGASGFS